MTFITNWHRLMISRVHSISVLFSVLVALMAFMPSMWAFADRSDDQSVVSGDHKEFDQKTLRLSRYVQTSTTSTSVQLHPLTEIVHFRPSSTTVGGAIREVLRGSGYSVDESIGLPGFDALTLPRVHKEFLNTEVIEIIHALAGPIWLILIDPVTRAITFQLQVEHF